MPRVLNARHLKKPWPPRAVYVGRPSKWGNPFIIGKHGSRDEVLAAYRDMLLVDARLLASLRDLRGKDLICWCAPEPCHADILLEFANS